MAKDKDNGDRDGAIIIGTSLLLLLAFAFIPFVNEIPEKLRIHKLIWHKPRSN